MGRHVDLWLEGWRRGDAQMVLSAVTEDFVYEDAVDGRFTKAEFVVYLEELFATQSTPEGFERSPTSSGTRGTVRRRRGAGGGRWPLQPRAPDW